MKLPHNPHVLLTFGKVHNPLPLPRKTTSEPSKVVRACGTLYILTWKCASRLTGTRIFDIATSKSGPNVWCALCILTWKRASRHNGVHLSERQKVVRTPSVFYTFDLETCFTPQRRTLFRHLNCQKCSERVVCFVHFDLEMCFSPHGVHFFDISTSKSAPNVWCALYTLTWTCASRHNGVQFFISYLAAGSARAALASQLFDPPEPQIIGKNTVDRDFPTFSRTCVFFLLSFSLL